MINMQKRIMLELLSRKCIIFMILLTTCFCIVHLIGFNMFNENMVYYQNDISVSLKNAKEYTIPNRTKLNTSRKLLLALCIISRNDALEQRKAIRNSWISTMHQMINVLPFSVTYKFILSFPSEDTLEENLINEDIIFLNKAHTKKKIMGGEMLFTLIKIINTIYDNATLVRMEDDVFLCVPEIFHRIAEIMSPNLYYGWKFGKAFSVSQYQPIDDMFVVLGENLVRRIAHRKLCYSPKCLPDELIRLHDGTRSLEAWLSIYTDVDFITDNKRIIHNLGKSNYSKRLQSNVKYMTKDFCRNHLIVHESSPNIMELLSNLKQQPVLYQGNGQKPSDMLSEESATSGTMFSGKVVRPLLKSIKRDNDKRLVGGDNNPNCLKWAVVTTIFTISTAVKNLIRKSEWCIVIVADKKTPTKAQYFKGLDFNYDSKKVKYLSLEEQEKLYPVLAVTIPMNSFSRKNIGYMYAIHHKADLIWDFDDDNYGVINVTKQMVSGYVTACPNFSSTVLNPYPYFGVNDSRTWPRGFPLQRIKSNKTIPLLCNVTNPLNIGVMQSLANGQPDVDAIYRLTREVPFKFSAAGGSYPALVIPLHSFSPFNGQATLWFKSTFRFIALPISVHGRVSDIWRSYIAQFFMHKENIHLAFTPPFVFQERNPHTIIKDFNAELDLYQKSFQLIDLLSSLNTTKHITLQKIYDMLYVRQYLEYNDLDFIKAWGDTFDLVMKLK